MYTMAIIQGITFGFMVMLFIRQNNLNKRLTKVQKDTHDTDAGLVKLSNDIPLMVAKHLDTDKHLMVVYLLVSLRADFMYNLARKFSETPPAMQWYYNKEKETVLARLKEICKDAHAEELEKIVNEFYAPAK